MIFSAHLLQIPVMLVTLPQPLSNCQAQPFVFLITPEKARLPWSVGTLGWPPVGPGEAAPLLLWHPAAAPGQRMLQGREMALGTTARWRHPAQGQKSWDTEAGGSWMHIQGQGRGGATQSRSVCVTKDETSPSG